VNGDVDVHFRLVKVILDNSNLGS